MKKSDLSEDFDPFFIIPKVLPSVISQGGEVFFFHIEYPDDGDKLILSYQNIDGISIYKREIPDIEAARNWVRDTYISLY